MLSRAGQTPLEPLLVTVPGETHARVEPHQPAVGSRCESHPAGHLDPSLARPEPCVQSEIADVSEFRHRILVQRPASPFVISNAVRGTWLGTGTPMLVPSADRQLWAAVGADDQLWVVRVYRRTGISVDRLAMHPLDEVVGRYT